MIFYVLDENNNKVEALDKEGVLNAIETAIQDGSLAGLVADAGFISKLKCCVNGNTSKIGFITQAQYNTLEVNGLLEKNTLYFITDDTLADDLEEQLKTILKDIEGLKGGTIPIASTKYADQAKLAEAATVAANAVQLGEVPAINILMQDTSGKNTSTVKRAETSNYVSGNDLVTTETSTVDITQAGLYVCTLAQYNGSTLSKYVTAIISIPSIYSNSEVGVIEYSTVQDCGAFGLCKVYYWTDNKYLAIYTDSTVYSYKFKDCRQLIQY